MAAEEKYTMLEAQGLSIGYVTNKKPSPISEGINLTLHAGELVGLVGANGVGKSTLLRTLAGMQPALTGDISIAGVPIAKITPLQLAAQLSVVLTEAPASKNLTVAELVTLGRHPHTNWMGSLSESDTERIMHALDITDTTTLAHKKCFELSDGQLQRATIARALAQDTSCIILDEPTTHLDLYHRAYILKLLKQLAHDWGKTILYSTHEIDLAIQLSDQMVVMQPNKVVVGTPCTLIEAGAFDALFPKDTIDFDRNTGRFSIKK